MPVRINPNLTPSFGVTQDQGEFIIDEGSGDITIVVVSPPAFAGTYTMNQADGRDGEKLNFEIASTRPQCILASSLVTDGGSDVGATFSGRPAVWIYNGDQKLPPERAQLTVEGDDILENTDIEFTVTGQDYGKTIGFYSAFGTEISTAPQTFTTPALTLQNDPEMAFVYTPNTISFSGGKVTTWANDAANGDTTFDLTVAGAGDLKPDWNEGEERAEFDGTTSLCTPNSKVPLSVELINGTKDKLTLFGVFEGTATTQDVFMALCQSNASGRAIVIGWDTQGPSGTSGERLYTYGQGPSQRLFGETFGAVEPTGPSYSTGKHIYELQVTMEGCEVYIDGVLQYEESVDLEVITDVSVSLPRDKDFMHVCLGGRGSPISAPGRQGVCNIYCAGATYTPTPEKIRAVLAAEFGISI